MRFFTGSAGLHIDRSGQYTHISDHGNIGGCPRRRSRLPGCPIREKATSADALKLLPGPAVSRPVAFLYSVLAAAMLRVSWSAIA